MSLRSSLLPEAPFCSNLDLIAHFAFSPKLGRPCWSFCKAHPSQTPSCPGSLPSLVPVADWSFLSLFVTLSPDDAARLGPPSLLVAGVDLFAHAYDSRPHVPGLAWRCLRSCRPATPVRGRVVLSGPIIIHLMLPLPAPVRSLISLLPRRLLPISPSLFPPSLLFLPAPSCFRSIAFRLHGPQSEISLPRPAINIYRCQPRYLLHSFFPSLSFFASPKAAGVVNSPVFSIVRSW